MQTYFLIQIKNFGVNMVIREKRYKQYMALLSLFCYLLIILHPVIGHYNQIFSTHSSSHQQIISVSNGDSNDDCAICHQMANHTQFHSIFSNIKLEIKNTVLFTQYIADFSPERINYKNAPRAPPII